MEVFNAWMIIQKIGRQVQSEPDDDGGQTTLNNGIKVAVLTVRFLVTRSGARTAKLLGLVSSGIRYEEGSVVSNENVFNLLLGGFIDVFLVVGDEAFGNRLTNRINLRDVTSTVDPDADVNSREAVFAEQKDRLLQLLPQRTWLDQMKRSSIHFYESISAFAVSHRRRRLFLPNTCTDC